MTQYARDPVQARLFNTYRNIRQVSANPNNRTYKITKRNGVDPYCEWNSFQEFYTWVLATLGEPPWPGARLVRKNQLKPWTRRNLEWNTHLAQGRRLVSTHKIKYRGRTQTLTEWAQELNISHWTVRQRIHRGETDPKRLFHPGMLKG